MYTFQWQILIWRSGLAQGYATRKCTVLLDATSGTGFATETRVF